MYMKTDTDKVTTARTLVLIIISSFYVQVGPVGHSKFQPTENKLSLKGCGHVT